MGHGARIGKRRGRWPTPGAAATLVLAAAAAAAAIGGCRPPANGGRESAPQDAALLQRAEEGLRTLKRLSTGAAPLPVAETFSNRPSSVEALLPARSAPAAAARPVLKGIVWQPSQPLAMLNDQLVGRDETIAGWTVVEIAATAVTLRNERGEQTVLNLYEH